MSLNITQLSSTPVEGVAYKSNLSAYKGSVFGGTEYGKFNGFVSLDNWMYSYTPNNGTLQVWKENDEDVRYEIFTSIFGISEISFTFDKQMLPVASYMQNKLCYIYFFDSSLNSYNTLNIPNAISPKVALSSIHFSHVQDSEVILGYVTENKKLCIRLQKDRYSIEYPIKIFDKKIKLYNIGYSNKNRFQYEVLESSV